MVDNLQTHIPLIEHAQTNLNQADFLRWLAEKYENKIVLSTSFSFEDQVITDMILRNQIPISIFTLDTGRLFPETYSTWSRTVEKYSANITAYFPDHLHLEEFLTTKGPNSFYESVDNRKSCCYLRKVEPLKRALLGKSIWITGLRAEHSNERKTLKNLEWDETNQVIKYHPLLTWTSEAVRQYINEHDVPYNILHDKGFVSIGCAPCTRAIKPGEDFRAGRWWWEDAAKKECGLHVHQ
jgi:phosphoadenosine phosphosulfate reductase